MRNRNYIIGAIIVCVVILAAWYFSNQETGMNDQETDVALGDPIDVVADFYSDWLSAVQSTSTDPYRSGYAEGAVLAENVRAQLHEARETETDPVLCNTATPERFGTRVVFTTDTQSKIMVLFRGGDLPQQALVSLDVVDNSWRITDIACNAGETAPEREFSFEKEGNLLKSVPEPLDPQYWHLVFEENGQRGHTAPLFFDAGSTCVTTDGVESICDPEQFTEAAKARVQGEMSESGVTVKWLRFLE